MEKHVFFKIQTAFYTGSGIHLIFKEKLMKMKNTTLKSMVGDGRFSVGMKIF